MPGPVHIGIDDVEALINGVRELTQMDLLIGIPDENAGRPATADEPRPLSNAVIGYAHEFGVPDHNLPARPSLIPGVMSMKDTNIAGLKKAAELAILGDVDGVRVVFQRLGVQNVSAVRKIIEAGDFTPLAPRTLAERVAKLSTKKPGKKSKYTQSPRARFEAAGGIGSPTAVAAFIKILQDTGSFRNAFTFVVTKNGRKVL